MKKIWILERYFTTEERNDMGRKFLQLSECEYDVKEKETLLKIGEEDLNATEGYWYPVNGKCNYNALVNEAIDLIRYCRSIGKNIQYRVLKAELIIEEYNYWVNNYKNAEVNDGVTRYIYAVA